VGFLGSTGIANDTDFGLNLTEAVEIPLEVRAIEIVVEHEDRDVDVVEVAVLDSTVFPSTGDEPEGVRLSCERNSVKEPDILGTTGNFNRERVTLAFSFGVGVSLDLGPGVGVTVSRALVPILRCVESPQREVRGEIELVVADALD
jgi:hypothetical protein